MLLNAKNHTLPMGDTTMDYITFGKGEEYLVMIPGLSDGLMTVKGVAFPFALAYRDFVEKYSVFVFSRKNHLPEGYTTREMAVDLAEAMAMLGITKANVLGISQGGMIAQYLALDYQESVKKLVLAVTLCRPNETVIDAATQWIAMAEENRYSDIVIDTFEKSYSEKFLEEHRYMYPILSRLRVPKDNARFIIEAHSCMNHNTYQRLEEITCETLVIGGDDDKIVGAHSSEELAERLPNSELILYHGLGHGTYEEAEDFSERIVTFLEK